MPQKILPIGTEDFKDIREKNFYYVDKTNLIKELITEQAKVTLFTRPRRFGKTLNISMLQYFFEIGTEKTLFDELAISHEKEICEKYMGQYPVISISLKGVEGRNYESAYKNMWNIIQLEANRLDFLEDSEQINSSEKQQFTALQNKTGDLENSLKLLSSLLAKHFQKKVIILIDEYDVPLDKAYHRNYYEDMILLIRQMFGNALKTNPYLEFAVLTGCLRISKESVFTGLNNLVVHTIADIGFEDSFGFTDKEVRELLSYYNVEEKYSLIKEWYDGYHFGKTNIYCPWDVVNYCHCLQKDFDSKPANFWINTSSNDLVLKFAQMADDNTRQEIANLIDGKSVSKKLDLNLTYAEIEEDINNLWSVLYITGYLTSKSSDEFGSFDLFIPNKEIRSIFVEKIDKWFSDKVLNDSEGLKDFIDCLLEDDSLGIQDCLLDILDESISYLDGGQTVELKESFYHGLLLGMLKSNANWSVLSNREAGSGRADIIVYPRKRKWGNFAFIFEIKYAKPNENLEEKAAEALAQIENRKYDNFFLNRKMKSILHYGIAFRGKECYVAKS